MAKSPFPGMDPYLERYWGDVHHSFCTYSRDALQRQIRPALLARLEERLVVETDEYARPRPIVPDVKIDEWRGGPLLRGGGGVGLAEPLILRDVAPENRTEGWINVTDPLDGNRLVTVIEFLSPANKRRGRDLAAYGRKQDDLFATGVSLVEIDLLRSGLWAVHVPLSLVPEGFDGPYRVCVHRGWAEDSWEFHHLPLRRPLPRIGIPLRRGDADAALDLQAVLDQVYENGAYDAIDYARSPDPPLDPADAAWANERIASSRHPDVDNGQT